MLDLRPILGAGPIVDPAEHQAVGAERQERVRVELARFDRRAFRGLALDEPIVLPGGDRQQR